MKHDPMCDKYVEADLPKGECWACHAIAAARADEQNKIAAERSAKFGVWHDWSSDGL